MARLRTTAEVAALLGISKSRVRQVARAAALYPVVVGQTHAWLPHQVTAIRKRNRVRGRPVAQ